METRQQPEAALWDFDGTLVDSSALWFTAEKALVEHVGGSGWTPQQSAEIHGYSMPDGAQVCFEFAGQGDAGLDPQWGARVMGDYFMDALRTTGLTWLPGAWDLLMDVKAQGVPVAVVSATAEPILQMAMRDLPPNTFDAIIGGDRVTHGKPHPESYLVAADTLGVDPTRSVAFEDSPEGCASAQGAGCFVVAINFHQRHESAPGRMPVDTLEALTWKGVVGEYERWVAAR